MWKWHYVQEKNLLVNPQGEIKASVWMESDLLYHLRINSVERVFFDLDSAKAAAELVYNVKKG